MNNKCLTKRELEVLNLIALGKSRKAIAEDLVISIQTVRDHLASMRQVLDAHNDLQIFLNAKKRNLI